MMTDAVHIAAFYAFRPLNEEALTAVRAELHTFGAEHDLRGLVLLAGEGVNGTVCGAPPAIAAWKELLVSHFGEMRFNDSTAPAHVFPRWLVKIRPEIVSLKQPDVRPQGPHRHLTPEEFDAMLEGDDVVVLDTRNTYETDIGTFEGAVDPRITHFSQFPDYVKSGAIPKDKKVLMYCTGGIRCEKALIEMEKQGYENVYQLKGGILNYIRRFPGGKFKGECFVFDHRVAVDQELKPSSRYALCPHCGDPGDVRIVCAHCEQSGVVCAGCLKDDSCRTCSKDCRNKLAVTA